MLSVGAGPLEDLVHEHGHELLGDIEKLARGNPNFREALRGVYVGSELAADVR